MTEETLGTCIGYSIYIVGTIALLVWAIMNIIPVLRYGLEAFTAWQALASIILIIWAVRLMRRIFNNAS
jgi:hypothetical protein